MVLLLYQHWHSPLAKSQGRRTNLGKKNSQGGRFRQLWCSPLQRQCSNTDTKEGSPDHNLILKKVQAAVKTYPEATNQAFLRTLMGCFTGEQANAYYSTLGCRFLPICSVLSFSAVTQNEEPQEPHTPPKPQATLQVFISACQASSALGFPMRDLLCGDQVAHAEKATPPHVSPATGHQLPC